MASTSETGYTKNVANFETLISFVTAYGEIYNPSKDSLKLAQLQTLLAAAKDSLNTVNNALSTHSNAVAARESLFKPFGKLITRVNNALKATDTTPEVDDSAKTIVRKLQGTRASAKLTAEEKSALEAEGKEMNQISNSQMGYDDQVENFDKLISLLTSIPQYTPNEEELKVSSLSTLRDTMRTGNTRVITANVQLSNARIARNKIQENPNSGLVDIALDTKTYIKSVFGASSPQYKQISKLEFKKINS